MNKVSTKVCLVKCLDLTCSIYFDGLIDMVDFLFYLPNKTECFNQNLWINRFLEFNCRYAKGQVLLKVTEILLCWYFVVWNCCHICPYKVLLVHAYLSFAGMLLFIEMPICIGAYMATFVFSLFFGWLVFEEYLHDQKRWMEWLWTHTHDMNWVLLFQRYTVLWNLSN